MLTSRLAKPGGVLTSYLCADHEDAAGQNQGYSEDFEGPQLLRCGAEHPDPVYRESGDQLGSDDERERLREPCAVGGQHYGAQDERAEEPRGHGAQQSASGGVGFGREERPGQPCEGRRRPRDADKATEAEVPQPYSVDDHLKGYGYPRPHRQDHRWIQRSPPRVLVVSRHENYSDPLHR